ncbi:GntR family transcriptional regulator [Gammaproteobacteria bacterium]|nr:GntR family transcriptional regulator [Gammaproteobacteria bacterium]
MSDMNARPSTNYRTYQDVKLEVLKHIAKFGAPGQRLSSEREWCDLLQVSRPTIRQALQSLEIEGEVQRKRGSGWYVSMPPLRIDPSKYIPFNYAAIQQGRKPSWQEIKIEKHIPRPEIATILGIRSNRQVPKIQILLELDSLPVALETYYVNPNICSDPSEINTLLPTSDDMQRISGFKLYNQRLSIKSTNCGEYAAKLMGIHAESPALLIKRWFGDNKELTVYFNEVLWRASALELFVEPFETN